MNAPLNVSLSLWLIAAISLTSGEALARRSMATRPPAKRGLVARLQERWTLGSVYRQVQRLSRQGQRPVVVVDVDNTLLDPTLRATSILRHLGRRCDVSVLKSFTYRGENAGDLYRLVGAEVKDPAKLQRMGGRFARLYDRLGASGRMDRLAPGAVSYLQALHRAGATIVYLTGRSERVHAATLRTLARVGFPVPAQGDDRALLITRPERIHDVVAFKSGQLSSISSIGRVVATFDDDPANCRLFSARFPGARTVFVQMHDKDKPAAAGLRRIRDFSAWRPPSVPSLGRLADMLR